jgi:NADPH:quinone reductase-like Zn-dependent oxidoreductase
MGTERIIIMSRHQSRQKLAREFGATDIIAERGDEAVSRINELTNGIGADAVLECVGTQDSMSQAIRSTRPGGVRGLRRRSTWSRAQGRAPVKRRSRQMLGAGTRRTPRSTERMILKRFEMF